MRKRRALIVKERNMPAEIMIVNPIGKKKGTKMARRARKMSPLQRLYFGKKRSRSSSSRRRRRSRPHVTYARRNPPTRSVSLASAPRRRRSARTLIRYARRRASSPGVTGFIGNDLLPAAIGAGGALAMDMIWPHLTFLPESLQTGPLLPVTRIGAALAIGFGIGMVGGTRMGRAATVGALTVTAYDMAKGYLAANAAPPASPAASDNGTSGYAPQLGWRNPARDAGPLRYRVSGYAPEYA
jgi:hypothetical protein